MNEDDHTDPDLWWDEQHETEQGLIQQMVREVIEADERQEREDRRSRPSRRVRGDVSAS